MHIKLNQLRYICEVARRGLNVSAAAEALYTSQPGVSKQIRQLEDALGLQIFARSGKQFSHITPAGQAIIEEAERVLLQIENIRAIAQEFRDEKSGSLSIATTNTQARHALPPVVTAFRKQYPSVSLHMHQGTPMQIADMAARGAVDFAIATEALELFEDLVMLPCYRWNRSIVVPEGHPLTRVQPLTLEEIAKYPIVTYVFGFTGRSKLDQAFEAKSLKPNVVFTATDSEVIKTYVGLGLGIGIIASMAFEPERDHGLVALKADHLFDYSITSIAFRRGIYLRRYMREFIKLFAPHVTDETIERAITARTKEERNALYDELEPRLLYR